MSLPCFSIFAVALRRHPERSFASCLSRGVSARETQSKDLSSIAPRSTRPLPPRVIPTGASRALSLAQSAGRAVEESLFDRRCASPLVARAGIPPLFLCVCRGTKGGCIWPVAAVFGFQGVGASISDQQDRLAFVTAAVPRISPRRVGPCDADRQTGFYSRVSSVEEASTAECVVIPFAAKGIRHTFSTFHESIRHCGSNEASAYSMPVIMEFLDSIFSTIFTSH